MWEAEKVPVAFWDVAACFTEEDWKLLYEGQKIFYKNVMKKIHQMLITLGFQILNPETLLRVIKQEDANHEDPEIRRKGADLTDTTSSHDTAASPTPDVLLRIKCEHQRICKNNHTSEETDVVNSLRTGPVKSEVIPASETAANSAGYQQSSEENESSEDWALGNENAETLMEVIEVIEWEEENQEDSENPKRASADLRDPRRQNTLFAKTENLPENPRIWDINRKEINPTEDDEAQPAVLVSEPSEKSNISDRFTKHEENSEDPPNVTKHQSFQVRPHKSKYCNEAFVQHSQLMENMRIHREQKSFVLDHIHSMDWEMVIAGEKPYKCMECKKTFSQLSNLKDHQRIHTGEKPYECTECRKAFTQLSTLRVHQRIHTGEKPYGCSECSKSFTQLSAMQRHQKSHAQEKSFECTVCEKAFIDSSALKVHLRRHSGEKPYECTECSKCFPSRQDLNGHKKTHTGEKPYECAVCKKCYSKPSVLKMHQRIHTGEKPYECTQCEKSFCQQAALKRHQRVHTGEKPFACTKCEKTFRYNTELKVHQIMHTGEKPYVEMGESSQSESRVWPDC